MEGRLVNNTDMKFLVRANKEIIAKVDYIAQYHGISRNAEVNLALRKLIVDFEKEVEPIQLDSSDDSSK